MSDLIWDVCHTTILHHGEYKFKAGALERIYLATRCAVHGLELGNLAVVGILLVFLRHEQHNPDSSLLMGL